MEVSDDNIRTLSQYLLQTLSPDPNIRRPAEKFLEGIEVNQNYPLVILHLIHKPEVDSTIRIAGSIIFKNYIKRNWNVDEDQTDRIHETDRSAIKNLIVTLMLNSPEAIQKQLSDAISIIGKTDFPLKWPELIKQMVEKFATGDFYVINGVLQTGHSLFKKYRYETQSNELWGEIKYVLNNLAQPLTDLLLATIGLSQQYANDANALKIIYNSLLLICKVFYSLNYQDLPEFFEDNMPIWMPKFHDLLNVEVPSLATGEQETAGVIEQLKSQICDNIALYAQKYDDEFKAYLPQFVTDIWNLLVKTGIEPKYDLLVSNALQFLSSVAERAQYRNLFEDDAVLSRICENVIIPNMEFRTSDEELFEDNPEEYICRDIEGSDVGTRRRAACDLVNTLSQKFEKRIIDIFGQYLQVMLARYGENPKQNWRSKDATIYLVTSLASRGATQKHGVTHTTQLVPLLQFCQEQILPELNRPNNDELPVLKADAIKYLLTFRSVLPRDLVVGSLPLLITHLLGESAVVHTYAASTIEKILIMKDNNNQNILTGEQLQPFAGQIFANLLSVLEKPVSEENEYIMKAIMRCFATLQQNVMPYLQNILPKLTEKLQAVAKNPSKPHFNHYLFESIALSIRIVCSTNATAVSSFEEILFPIFQGILQQDIQEFIPYVFQILSLLMEFTPVGKLSDSYMPLLPPLLLPTLWERPANINPLVRLLTAFTIHVAPQIVAQDKLGNFLGIFQKLISTKHDREGFHLLQSMIQHIPREALAPHHKQIFIRLFQKLSSRKTTRCVIEIITFFSLYAVKFSANELVSVIDDIQARMFGMVLEKLFIAELQKVTGTVERKIVACGITKILCESEELYKGSYQTYWPQLFQALLKFFEMPPDETAFPDDHFIEIDDGPSFQTTNAKLNFANNTQTDPLQAITNPRQFLAQHLAALSRSQPGKLPTLISNMDQQSQTILQQYISQFGVQLI